MQIHKKGTFRDQEGDWDPPVKNTLDPDVAVVNFQHARLIRWFETVRFRKTCFGGVSEADLREKLSRLNGLYEAALKAERARYDDILESYLKYARQSGGIVLRASEAGREGYPPLGQKRPAVRLVQKERGEDS